MYSCARCGAPFEAAGPRRPNRKYCDNCKVGHHNKRDMDRADARADMAGEGHGHTHAHRAKPRSSTLAAWCGTCLTEMTWDGGTACPACGTPWPRRRAGRKLRLEVAERDGWICHRCQRPIDPSLPPGHPLALVADHFPGSLSEGGPTIPANLKAAHSLCNSRAPTAM